MRHRFAKPFVALVAVVSLLAGCGGTAASDPYELVRSSVQTAWSPVQINIGLTATAGGKTVTLDPKSIAIVVDSAGGKGAFHLSLSAASLEIPASALLQLGITGDTIDFDVVYDGTALYAKSAVLKPLIQFVLGSSGKVPAGDLTGWLKLGTKEELAAFAAMGRAGVSPSVAPVPDAAGLKAALEEAGVTLTVVGAEKRNGVDAQHVKVAIDSAKLVNNPNFASGAGNQYAQVAAALKTLTISGDLWIDAGSKRVIETDFHGASTSGSSDTVDVAVTAHDPDGTVPLDGPATAVDVPMSTLLGEMMKLMGQSIGG